MAETVSPAAGRRSGVARVCRVWDVPRSSFYAARAAATRPPVAPARRGPKPTIADADLLAAIRADLARSPWSGEGHRKVWARLRAIDGIRVARKRVLRLMRENALLSPHRAKPRPVETHDRSIVTEAPNRGPRAVVFMDSFGPALVPFLSEDFSRVVYLWQDNMDPQVVQQEGPQVVIQELVGRAFSTLVPYNPVPGASAASIR